MPPQEPTIHETGAPAVAYAHEQPIEDREQWLDEDQPLPPRPRRRLLTPLPLSLLAVLLVACGFIGGVLVEKGQNGSSSGASGGASGFAARLKGLAGATGSGGAGRLAAGAAGASATGGSSGFTRPNTGTVAYVSGKTLYVTNSESNTVKVATSAATTVTKTVKTSVKGIHPGETVVITGAAASNGTINAESIRVGSLGAGAGGLAGLFGGGTTGGSATSGKASTGSGSSSSGPALFGSG
jgi:hypothetical protein